MGSLDTTCRERLAGAGWDGRLSSSSRASQAVSFCSRRCCGRDDDRWPPLWIWSQSFTLRAADLFRGISLLIGEKNIERKFITLQVAAEIESFAGCAISCGDYSTIAQMYNSVENELWRIFTFYSLHGDANQPELLRPANFVKFCKDCQITSRKLTPTVIELEITRLVSLLFVLS